MYAYQKLSPLHSRAPRATTSGPLSSAQLSTSPQLAWLHLCSILTVSFLWSLLIAASVRCHNSLAAYLYDQLPGYGKRREFHWLGCSYGLMVFLFVPLWSGVIDLYKLSYRVCAANVGLLAVLSGVVSAGIQDPGHLILTDAIVAGTAGSFGLATLALLIDDHFPDRSWLRVFATSFVQGNSLATFYLVTAFSCALPNLGWRGAFYGLAGCHCALAVAGAALFVRRPERYWERKRERQMDALSSPGGTSVIDEIREKPLESGWPRRVLSLSQEDFDTSRTVLLWLLERLIAAVITDGLFLYLLLRSDILDLVHRVNSDGAPSAWPPTNQTAFSSPATAPIALAFSTGSSFAYIAGGIFGGLARGHLLIGYMIGSLTVLCSLIGWLGVIGSGAAELLFSLACGIGVGAFNTFTYAASEEATGVPARSMFPFTKAVNGVSLVLLEVFRSELTDSGVKHSEILLGLLLLLSVGQISILLLIRKVISRRHLRAKRRPLNH